LSFVLVIVCNVPEKTLPDAMMVYWKRSTEKLCNGEVSWIGHGGDL
jgi:hypothetical protein